MISKFTISRDDSIYEAWPDLALTPGGKLVCVFSECTHHTDRGYTRIMVCDSADRGQTWSAKRAVTEGTKGYPFYNCARITQLKDGRLAIFVDNSALNTIFSSGPAMPWSTPHRAVDCQRQVEDPV